MTDNSIPKGYNNVPVFLSGTGFENSDALVGKANVEIDEENNRSIVTIETVGDHLNDFLKIGRLRAFSISAMSDGVDPEKAAEFHSKLEGKKSLWDQRTER